MVKHIKSINEFNDLIKEGKILVDFYAEWCGPCQMLAPNLEKIGEKIEVLKVNVDDNRDLAINYGVMSVPTLIFFENGKESSKKIGYLEIGELEELCKISN